MYKNIFPLITLIFFSLVLFQSSVSADNITVPGYYEIIFNGATTEFEGGFELPLKDSLLYYTPSVDDSISIHFGATFFADPISDSNEYWCSWNHSSPFDVFTITVGNGNDKFTIDGLSVSDNNEGASFRDYFYVDYVGAIEGIGSSFGYIGFDCVTQSGNFQMYLHSFDYPSINFTWMATLTSSLVLTEPTPSSAPEPCTLILLGTGLLGLARIRKKRGSKWIDNQNTKLSYDGL